MRSGIFFVCTATFVAVLAACAPAPPKSPGIVRGDGRGDVDARTIEAAGAQHYSTTGEVKYVQALAYPENAMPTYPAELLALRLPPTFVRVRLVVDAAGHVVDVTGLEPESTAADWPRFFAAVREACLAWRYSPLLRLDLSAGPTTIEDGDSTVTYEGRPTALPFHLDYEFRFVQHDGVPDVGGDDAPNLRR